MEKVLIEVLVGTFFWFDLDDFIENWFDENDCINTVNLREWF
jgi:hypothetical protein